MDKASDFGSEDCRFESCHGRSSLFFFSYSLIIFFETSSGDLCVPFALASFHASSLNVSSDQGANTVVCCLNARFV